MIAQRKGRVWFVIFLFFASSMPALSGTTGKLTGKVVDKSSREALIGVNIVVEGTAIGSPTDVEGGFTILNVPPGTYKVRASIVGYSPVVVSDVRVFIDQTTTVNLEMDATSVTIGEVVIAAQREIVRKDVTTSVTSFNVEELRALPIVSVEGITALQAGVEGGGTIIRGGSSDQSLFLLDGATMRDPRNNEPIRGVPLSSVSEIAVERGSFNAEYGQVRSGIINVVTKEGVKDKYTLTLTARVRPPARKYFGESPFDANSFWHSSFLDPNVAWTGTKNGGWDYYTQIQHLDFEGWNAISKRLLTNEDSTDDLSPADLQRLYTWEHRRKEKTNQFDYNFDGGIGGPIPFVGQYLGDLRFFLAYRNQRDMLLVPLSRDDYYEDNWSLRLTSNISSSMKLNVTGTMGKSNNVAANGTEQLSSTDYIRSPDEVSGEMSLRPFSVTSRLFVNSYYSIADIKNYALNGLFSHVVSPTTFYEMRVEYLSRKYLTGPIRSRNTSKIYEILPGYFVDESPSGWSSDVGGTYDNMISGGHTSTARDSTSISAFTFKGDITSQVNNNHQVRAGFELVYNDLDLNYGVVNIPFPESNNYVLQRYFPLRGALFAQDKVEYKGFIANLGLRLDYSNANIDWYEISTYDKTFFEDPVAAQSYPRVASKAQWRLSPRLGISHPITEESKLFFNYGHFKQLPTYEQMLRYSRNVTGSLRNLGDPELEMANTVAYELGYDHVLFEEYLLQIAGFYRDIQDQQAFSYYISGKKKGNFRYQKPNNNSYQDIRGFEITVRKQGGRWVSGFANYTYQSSKSGLFGRTNIFEDVSEQKRDDLNTAALYQFKPLPTPFARMDITLFTPSEFGPGVGSTSIFGDWSINVFGEWRSGGFTSVSNFLSSGSSTQLYTVPSVDYYNMNLRISKSVKIGLLGIDLFVDVQNVLNTRRLNLNSFYDSYDQERYFNSLHLDPSAYDKAIPGEDKVGDYRPDDVAYQPVIRKPNTGFTPSNDKSKEDNDQVIYYDASTKKYMNYINGAWSEVDAARMNDILDKKAYVDMPNMKSFWFLNPRNIFFGIRTTIEF